MALDVAIKPPCRVATTANVTLSGLQTIDGEILAANNRVLVREQTDAIENGIYLAKTTAWVRAYDFNDARDVAVGTLVYVWGGSTTQGWHEVTTAAPVIGSTAIEFRHWTWDPPLVYGEASVSGSSTADGDGASYFYADMSAAGTSDVVIQAIPAAVIESSGTSAATMEGSWLASAAAFSEGAAEATAFPTENDLVYVMAGRSDGGDAKDVAQNVEKFDLSLRTVSIATAISHSIAAAGYSGCGDTSRARMHGSEDFTTASLRYSYSTEATSAGATMGGARALRQGFQSSTVGYFCGGQISPDTVIANTDKVTFSTEARTAGTSLGSTRLTHAACGNYIKAIIACGINNSLTELSSTDKYTFATDTRVAGTSLSEAKDDISAFSNTTVGIFTAGGWTGNTKNTEEYTFSGDTKSNTTDLSPTWSNSSGASNNTLGIDTGGGDSILAGDSPYFIPFDRITSYQFSDATVTEETALTHTKSYHVAVCDNPGGFF